MHISTLSTLCILYILHICDVHIVSVIRIYKAIYYYFNNTSYFSGAYIIIFIKYYQHDSG